VGLNISERAVKQTQPHRFLRWSSAAPSRAQSGIRKISNPGG
jgi:hypothetical protein